MMSLISREGHKIFCLFPSNVSSEGPNLKIYTAPMVKKFTTSAMGASYSDAKKHRIGINSMCVAYSRTKNIGDILTYCKDDCLYGPPVSSYME